jgi:hypothetical protein
LAGHESANSAGSRVTRIDLPRLARNLSGDHTTQKSKTRLGGGLQPAEAGETSDLGRTEFPQIQAFRQAETLFPLTGDFCAGFTALFQGGLSHQPERRSYVFH